MKFNEKNPVPLPRNISLTTEARGWNESLVFFDELGCPKMSIQRLFLQSFFRIVRDASYIRPGSFFVASNIKRGQEYCLSSTILISIYKSLAEYFRTYDLGDKVLSKQRMVKFSCLGCVKSFDLDEARNLTSSGGANIDFSTLQAQRLCFGFINHAYNTKQILMQRFLSVVLLYKDSSLSAFKSGNPRCSLLHYIPILEGTQEKETQFISKG
ncbi:hypothetical protein Cgig2_012504 [Carnegiea gigantea]|uniref:Uncharacterized protein n=1 Tax=Carnegiea gigantea TaxID=171969 RepID=A0A9Q1QE09_9CARY|nr:hypothetical protein Cgig2_012504 [Carnegiea gigantea]